MPSLTRLSVVAAALAACAAGLWTAATNDPHAKAVFATAWSPVLAGGAVTAPPVDEDEDGDPAAAAAAAAKAAVDALVERAYVRTAAVHGIPMAPGGLGELKGEGVRTYARGKGLARLAPGFATGMPLETLSLDDVDERDAAALCWSYGSTPLCDYTKHCARFRFKASGGSGAGDVLLRHELVCHGPRSPVAHFAFAEKLADAMQLAVHAVRASLAGGKMAGGR